MSAAGKARIGAAQKARWAATKVAGSAGKCRPSQAIRDIEKLLECCLDFKRLRQFPGLGFANIPALMPSFLSHSDALGKERAAYGEQDCRHAVATFESSALFRAPIPIWAWWGTSRADLCVQIQLGRGVGRVLRGQHREEIGPHVDGSTA